MRALATKIDSNGTAARSHYRAKHGPAPLASPFLISSINSALQRKPSCPCDGGCRRCAGESHHPNLQTKLTVSTPGDQYEQEADHVAEQVIRMAAPTLQQSCASCATGSAPCPECETDGLVQRKTERVSYNSGSVPDNFVQEPGPGQQLNAATRAFLEPRFGHDFSEVRVHTDTKAAESALQVSAQAYTVGRDIFLGAGEYQPETTAGRNLLAHELTHVLQQSGDGVTGTVETLAASKRAPAGRTASVGISRVAHSAAPPQVQRATDPDHSGPCDQPHIHDVIEPAFAEARTWRRLTAAWLKAHLAHIQARGPLSRDGYVTVGRRVFDDLMLLESHFKISTVLRISLPYSPDDLVSVADLERWANASYWVRRRFGEVELTLSYLCQANGPPGRIGSETLGSAVAGSREVTFYINSFDPQHEKTQAGVALHEAFHATFNEFDHDSYSFERSYPGDDALTNAESFSTFAAIVATGSNYRIPVLTVHGGP